MFNPVLNADGSVSYFRIACLIVAAACFVSGCVMDNSTTSESEAVAHKSAEIAQTQSVQSDKTADDAPDFDKIRSHAIREIIADSQYMQTCGAVDMGYVNCSVALSEELKPYYELFIDAADDGFALTLKAKDNNKDECRVFESDSNGFYRATDVNGLDNQNCTAMLNQNSKRFSILRDTDTNEGQSAPSGLSPIVKSLTKR